MNPVPSSRFLFLRQPWLFSDRRGSSDLPFPQILLVSPELDGLASLFWGHLSAETRPPHPTVKSRFASPSAFLGIGMSRGVQLSSGGRVSVLDSSLFSHP